MDEITATKSKAMRYKKPMSKELNWYSIREYAWQIQNDCADIRWMTEDEEQLVDLMDGDEEQAFEFRMAFSDLSNQCEEFLEELQELQRYDFMSTDSDDEDEATLFDLFFPAIGADDMYGYDVLEQDYFRLDRYEEEWAEKEARKKLKRLTKDQLFDLAGMALGIARNYMSLSYRYDCLKNSIDILKGKNESYLQIVKAIEEGWKAWEFESDKGKWKDTNAERAFDQMLQYIPERLWIE